MKKLFLIASLLIFAATEFKAQNAIKWPSGSASVPTVVVTTKVTAQTITVDNRLVMIDLGTIDTNKVITLDGASLNPYSQAFKPHAGDLLYIKYASDASARSLTFNTPSGSHIGFTSPVLSGTGSKTKVAPFIYLNATVGYIPLSGPFQIN